MSNIVCESYDQSWVFINECRLQEFNSEIVKMNLNISVLRPVHKIDVNLAFVKKSNGYKPFPINTTFDACEFMSKRSNPVGKLIYNLFKEFTNLNHSCPYVGDQIVDGFYLKRDLFPLQLPNGEYALLMTWYFNNLKTAVTNVYFIFYTKRS